MISSLFATASKCFSTSLLAGCLCVVGGCADTAPPPKAEKTKQPDQLVARVASVYKAENYALIQRYGQLSLANDSILYSRGANGKSANLKVTGERLGQFLAADILSGDLDIGDAVYLRIFENQDKSKVPNPDKINKP